MDVKRASIVLAQPPPSKLEVDASSIELGEAESLMTGVKEAALNENPSDHSNHVDTDSGSKSSVQDIKHKSRLVRLCRLLGLDFLSFYARKLKGSDGPEVRKIAVLKDLPVACYTSLLHLLPVSASILLTVFNLRGFYIGAELSGPRGKDDLKFLALQFVAKLLELMAMASLSSVLFALIRWQLLHDILPFGAVTSGFEFGRISLLWSKEFIATCSSQFGKKGSKPLLILTIIVFTILGASIGPSAATASIPTFREWPAGGTSFYVNATQQQLFPVMLNDVEPSELTCADGQASDGICFPPNYHLLATEILEHWPTSISAVAAAHFPPTIQENTIISGRISVRRITNRLRGGFVYNPDLTVVTTPMAFIADITGILAKYWFVANQALCVYGRVTRFCYYKDIANTIDAMQPLSFVKCTQSSINSSLSFARMDQKSAYPLVKLENSTYNSRTYFDTVTGNGSQVGLTWMSLPESSFGNTSLGAIVAIVGSNSTSDPGHFLACTIDARWVNSTAAATFLGGPLTVVGSFNDFDASNRFIENSKGALVWPRINITTNWADHLNPTINGNGTSIFDYLSRSVARAGNIAKVPNSLSAVEAILALMITEGISRIGNTASIQGSLIGIDTNKWWNLILPGGHVFGEAGEAFDFVSAPGDNSTKFVMQSTVSGYGYGPTTATVLSVIVLMIYSIIAILYVVYTVCCTKETSSAWESITELLALAVNSRSSPALANTGAGISKLSTLRETVYVGERDGLLEITFKKRRDGDTSGRIKENDIYG